MTLRSFLRTGVVAGFTTGWLSAASAVTLYDPAYSLPALQFWTTTGTPGYVESVSGGLYRFDTTASNTIMAGSAMPLLPFDTSGSGFEIDFGLQIVSESHNRPDRGGFSLIVTGSDPTHAIELAFWNDRVFAYTAGFGHGTEGLWSTNSFTAYALVVAADRYTLYANGASLLAGALVDYSAFGSPYTVPGLLFFGDDTSSAQASIALGRMTLTAPVPEPSATALALVSLLTVVGVVARRRAAAVQRGSSRG